MKHLLLSLLLASLASTAALADSPEAILKDYRKQATQALERLNLSLKNTTTPLITKLVSSGDTTGAEELTNQLKAKVAGELVPKPQASAAALFSLYDEAKARALEPVQKSSISRIDSMLKTAGGAKLEVVTELGKARAEIESGRVVTTSDLISSIPVEWTYRSSLTGPPLAKVFFEHDGSAHTEAGKDSQTGTWEMKKKGVFIAKLSKDTWTLTIKKGYAELESKNLSGLRYLVPVEAQAP